MKASVEPDEETAAELAAVKGMYGGTRSESGVQRYPGAKLGFSPVAAIDLEQQAVSETERNARANGVEIGARRLDALVSDLPEADVTVANISKASVEALGDRVRSARLVTSGYLASDEPALPGWEHLERRELDGWAADLSRRAVRRSTRSRHTAT